MTSTGWVARGGGGRGRASTLGLVVFFAAFAALALGRDQVRAFLQGHEAVGTWTTVFVATSVQALPFLALGVVLSSLIAVLLPDDLLRRLTTVPPALAVPAAGLSGVLLPGCECASVPVSRSLMTRGVAPAAALTFQLAAPAINPIVLVSTAVAFGGNTRMVGARFLASLLTAVVVGWVWLRIGRGDLVPVRRRRAPDEPRPGWRGAMDALAVEAAHDLLQAGGFLVVGAAVAATVTTIVPRDWLEPLATSPVFAVAAMALFAVVVAMCSEADAFVAAGLTMFPLSARLVFLVVGPVVDVKLIAMQVGVFGGAFARRFVPLCLVAAIGCAVAVGAVLL